MDGVLSMSRTRCHSRFLPALLPAFVAGACLAATPVVAQEDAAATPQPALRAGASYTGDFRRNTTGGLAVGDAYADSIDLGFEWTTSGLFSAATMTTSMSVMHLGGEAISGDYVGDAQGINNIEADQGWYLYESWVELGFGAHAYSLRGGVLDLNAEFDTPVTTVLFTQSSFGIGPDLSQSGRRGPGIWPQTGLGVRVAGDLTPGLHWRFGAYDGAPGTDDDAFTSTRVSRREGALLIGEIEWSNERIHKASFGSWGYTARFEPIDAALTGAARARGNDGYYALLDLKLGSAGGTDFDGALRAGTASGRFNVFDRYVGAALTASHLWAARPGDALGFGVAYAHTGAPYRALMDFQGQPATAAETSIELVYRAELTDWFSVLPMVQYVRDPGMAAGVDDAWIAGLRFEISRERSWQLSARRDVQPDESYARTQQGSPP
jgi:porin